MRINIRFSEIELNGQTTMSQLGYAKEMLKGSVSIGHRSNLNLRGSTEYEGLVQAL